MKRALVIALLFSSPITFGCNLHPGQSHELYLRLLKRVEELKAASAPQAATSSEPAPPAEKRIREEAPGAPAPAGDDLIYPPARSDGYFFSPFRR